MDEQDDRVTWPEVGMYVIGGVSGVVLGILLGLWMQGAVAAQSTFFWFVSRASAIVAYLMLWLSMAWGIAMSSKGLRGRVSGPLAYTLHNVTSWLALAFGAVHGLTLIGDASFPFTVPDVLIPFVSTYEPVLVGIGTLGLYLGVMATAAFYLRRLGLKVWRTIHGLSYLMFALVTVHSVALGSDTGTAVMKLMYVTAGASVALLTMFRVMTAKAGRCGHRPERKAVAA